MIDRAAIGAALRLARESLGMSAATAAQRIGCSERHIRRLEGVEAPLDIPRIEALCEVYRVHPMKVLASGYRGSVEIVITAGLDGDHRRILNCVLDLLNGKHRAA